MPLASLSVIDRGGQNPEVLISLGMICGHGARVEFAIIDTLG